MKNIDLASIDLRAIATQLIHRLRQLKPYAGITFFLFLALLYGFILFQINVLSGAQPDPAAVASQASSGRIPKVDEKVVQQLESLEDNSSSVRTLFDEARRNPFQE